MLIEIILFIGLGFILDFLITKYTQYLCSGKGLLAATLSVIITALNIFVFCEIVPEKNIVLTLAYLIGIFGGTYTAVTINREG